MIMDYKEVTNGDSIRGLVDASNIIGVGLYTGEDIKSENSFSGIIKQVPNEIQVIINNTGNANTEKSLTYSVETYKEMISFRLTAKSGERVTINRIKISLNYTNLASDNDWTNCRIYIDKGVIGTYEGVDEQIGGTIFKPVSGLIDFTGLTGLTLEPNSSTNILFVIDHKQMNYGKGRKSCNKFKLHKRNRSNNNLDNLYNYINFWNNKNSAQ